MGTQLPLLTLIRIRNPDVRGTRCVDVPCDRDVFTLSQVSPHGQVNFDVISGKRSRIIESRPEAAEGRVRRGRCTEGTCHICSVIDARAEIDDVCPCIDLASPTQVQRTTGLLVEVRVRKVLLRG